MIIDLKLAAVCLCLSVAVFAIADNQTTTKKTLKSYYTKYSTSTIKINCANENFLSYEKANKDDAFEVECMAGCVYKKMNWIVDGKLTFDELKEYVVNAGAMQKLFYETLFEVCPKRVGLVTDECSLGLFIYRCRLDTYNDMMQAIQEVKKKDVMEQKGYP